MDAIGMLWTGTMCLLMNCAMLSSTMAEEEGSALKTSWHLQKVEWPMAVAGMLCVVLIVVYAAISCTDCYKSEVSTECHPATGSSGVKWGGAGGYSAAATSDVNHSVLGAGFTGEVVLPESMANQPLPYALIPSGVPEAQGFRGYGPVETASTSDGFGSVEIPQPTLAGYRVSQDGQGGCSSLGIAQYSLRGYGGSGSEQVGLGYSEALQVALPSSGSSGGGGAGQSAGRNSGEGSSRPLPGAHVPLMSEEPQEPPPPYISSLFQR